LTRCKQPLPPPQPHTRHDTKKQVAKDAGGSLWHFRLKAWWSVKDNHPTYVLENTAAFIKARAAKAGDTFFFYHQAGELVCARLFLFCVF
jgi:hypothetical protein